MWSPYIVGESVTFVILIDLDLLDYESQTNLCIYVLLNGYQIDLLSKGKNNKLIMNMIE